MPADKQHPLLQNSLYTFIPYKSIGHICKTEKNILVRFQIIFSPTLFIGHVSLIVYLVMKRSLDKKPVDSSEANSDRVPTLTFNELLPTLHQEENSPQ